MKYIKSYPLWEAEEVGWQEWCQIADLGRFLAKLDTGNGTGASSLGVDSMEIDGDRVYWSCNGVDRQDPIKDWSHAEVGSTIDTRPVIILDIELGPHKLSGVPIALTNRSDKSTPVLVNRDLLSKLGVVVAPDRKFLLGESQEELAAAKRMLDLGLIEPNDFKQKLQQLGLDKQYRSEFVAALQTLFADLGLEWKDWATARQQQNGTVVLKFSPADAAEILFTADLPKGLSPAQEARYAKLKREMRQWQRQMEIETSTEGRSPFEYWIFPGSLRNSGRIGTPTSNRQVIFDGLTGPDAALARFMYQVALDAHGRSWRWGNRLVQIQHPS